MSKRGPRFTGKEKLAILKEGEKNGVKAVCAKYGVSEQTYQVWRYKTKGIEHKKQFSIKNKQRWWRSQNSGPDNRRNLLRFDCGRRDV